MNSFSETVNNFVSAIAGQEAGSPPATAFAQTTARNSRRLSMADMPVEYAKLQGMSSRALYNKRKSAEVLASHPDHRDQEMQATEFMQANQPKGIASPASQNRISSAAKSSWIENDGQHVDTLAISLTNDKLKLYKAENGTLVADGSANLLKDGAILTSTTGQRYQYLGIRDGVRSRPLCFVKCVREENQQINQNLIQNVQIVQNRQPALTKDVIKQVFSAYTRNGTCTAISVADFLVFLKTTQRRTILNKEDEDFARTLFMIKVVKETVKETEVTKKTIFGGTITTNQYDFTAQNTNEECEEWKAKWMPLLPLYKQQIPDGEGLIFRRKGGISNPMSVPSLSREEYQNLLTAAFHSIQILRRKEPLNSIADLFKRAHDLENEELGEFDQTYEDGIEENVEQQQQQLCGDHVCMPNMWGHEKERLENYTYEDEYEQFMQQMEVEALEQAMQQEALEQAMQKDDRVEDQVEEIGKEKICECLKKEILHFYPELENKVKQFQGTLEEFQKLVREHFYPELKKEVDEEITFEQLVDHKIKQTYVGMVRKQKGEERRLKMIDIFKSISAEDSAAPAEWWKNQVHNKSILENLFTNETKFLKNFSEWKKNKDELAQEGEQIQYSEDIPLTQRVAKIQTRLARLAKPPKEQFLYRLKIRYYLAKYLAEQEKDGKPTDSNNFIEYLNENMGQVVDEIIVGNEFKLGKIRYYLAKYLAEQEKDGKPTDDDFIEYLNENMGQVDEHDERIARDEFQIRQYFERKEIFEDDMKAQKDKIQTRQYFKQKEKLVKELQKDVKVQKFVKELQKDVKAQKDMIQKRRAERKEKRLCYVQAVKQWLEKNKKNQAEVEFWKKMKTEFTGSISEDVDKFTDLQLDFAYTLVTQKANKQ